MDLASQFIVVDNNNQSPSKVENAASSGKVKSSEASSPVHVHHLTNSDTNLLLLIRQQAEEIRKVRRELLNMTNERDALQCEVHHLKMDILAAELGRLGSCSTLSAGGEFCEIDEEDEDDEVIEQDAKMGNGVRKKVYLNGIKLRSPGSASSGGSHNGKHFLGTSVDDDVKMGVYSSSEMTRLSTSSSSSSASSSPVLFTSSQSSSSQFHDSTEETGESGIVERTYGGQPARKAALVIQRAFRRYSMVKEFHRIKTERRLSRRINNNAPPTNANGGTNGCEVCVDLYHLSSSEDHLHHLGGAPQQHQCAVNNGIIRSDGGQAALMSQTSASNNVLPPLLPINNGSYRLLPMADIEYDTDHHHLHHLGAQQQHQYAVNNGTIRSNGGQAAVMSQTSSSNSVPPMNNSSYRLPMTDIEYETDHLRHLGAQQHQYAVNHGIIRSGGRQAAVMSQTSASNNVPSPPHPINNVIYRVPMTDIECEIDHHHLHHVGTPQQHQCAVNNGIIRNGGGQAAVMSQTSASSVPPPLLPINNSSYRLPMTDIECEILRKRLYRVGLNLFNKKPEVGISYLVKKKFIEGTAGAVSRFLISRKGLSKQMIGEYLANLQNPFCQSCLDHFSSEIDLSKMPIDLALRRFQTFLRMPGEAQKIERIMETFSHRYGVCNPHVTGQFRNGADTVFVLAFAIIMLNTDLHTPHLKADRRMKMEDFIKNLRGIDDGADIPREILVQIYERIKQTEFRTGSDHVTQVMKVQQTIVGKKPNLALAHRRLVCYCRLYEVADVNKREKVGSHQREVFLFNDNLVLTKIFHKKRNSVTYSFRQSYPLMGITLVLFTNQHFEFGLSLRRGETVLLNLNARNEHDRAKFAEDLREAIAESDEMGRMESLFKENRDSGVDVGKIKRFSNSLLDINDQCKPTRRGSCGSLDSGMSISFHSDENQQSQQHSNNNSSRSSSSICHKHQNSSCSNSSTSTTQSK